MKNQLRRHCTPVWAKYTIVKNNSGHLFGLACLPSLQTLAKLAAALTLALLACPFVCPWLHTPRWAALTLDSHPLVRTLLSLWCIRTLLLRPTTMDSVEIFRDFGLQVSTTGKYYVFSASSRFTHKSQILDVLIHEVFVGLTIQSTLVVVLVDRDRLLVAFENVLPSLSALEQVWREATKLRAWHTKKTVAALRVPDYA